MNGLIRKLLLLVLAVTVFLAGCGTSPESYAQSNYDLINAQTNGTSLQKVYRAANQSVPEVAQQLANQNQPEQISRTDNQQMFLVYPDQVINVSQDPQNPSDSLVEIDSMQFVRDHYDPGFLEPFLAGAILGHIFGNNWRYSPNYGTGYRGYGYSHYGPYSGGSYKPPSYTPPGGTYTPPKSSGGKGTVIPRSGSGTNQSPGSSGGFTTPPKSSGGYSTPPRSSGGGFFSPPRSSGGKGGVVRRR